MCRPSAEVGSRVGIDSVSWYSRVVTDVKTRTNQERDDTDGSLRDERSRTDEELAKRRAIVEHDADAVVELARRRADDVLATARARADRKLEQSAAPRTDLEIVSRERSAEDAVLAAERSAAREQLRLERASRAEIVAELLLLERTQTDRHLALERAGADAEVKARDDFLGIVAHDLRTLLHGIGMSAWVVLHEAGEDPAKLCIRDEALRTQRYVARMNRLLGDLLDVVSIDAGRLPVVPAEDDAVKLVRETEDVFKPLATANRIELTTEASADSLPGWLDRERIMQVLANLVSNAIKFTDAGGAITVGVRAVDGAMQFSVRDTGHGIASDRLPGIFDRFAQARHDRRGFGLGLYISRCIVEAHGGRLWVESQLGEGTTFTFTVPASPAATTS